MLIDFCLIFVPFGHYDEPEILRYAITSICPKGADVRQRGGERQRFAQDKGSWRLRPDYGTRLKKDGHDSPHVEHFFYGLPISGFDALGRPGQYSLTVDTMYAGERHCLSLDFGPAPLAAILAALPAHIRQSIEIQMSRDPNTPRQFKFPHPVHCESVAATLGNNVGTTGKDNECD